MKKCTLKPAPHDENFAEQTATNGTLLSKNSYSVCANFAEKLVIRGSEENFYRV